VISDQQQKICNRRSVICTADFLGALAMTLIILVRHGQTEWNRVEHFRGRADVPLNAVGLAQAEVTGLRVASEWQPVAVYSSPLVRAIRTGEAIAKHFDLPVNLHSGIADIDYGEWQGLTPDEVKARWPDIYHAWYDQPHLARIPGGETLDDLRTRGMAAVNELAAHHDEQTIVLVGHTVINRIILLGVLGLSNDRFWHLHQDTCAINVFEVKNGDYVLVSLNDTCHLRSILSSTT
jgi:probable phosphoglycerate mutase